MIALTSITLHYALRDVALVLITGAGLAVIAEGMRGCLRERVGHARISEGYKEDKRTDGRI